VNRGMNSYTRIEEAKNESRAKEVHKTIQARGNCTVSKQRHEHGRDRARPGYEQRAAETMDASNTRMRR